MRAKELIELLAKHPDAPVWFFNPDEINGSQYYDILMVELLTNDEGKKGLVLTDNPEGARPKP